MPPRRRGDIMARGGALSPSPCEGTLPYPGRERNRRDKTSPLPAGDFLHYFFSFACIFDEVVIYLIHPRKRERSLVAESELPKLVVRVRFPSLAPEKVRWLLNFRTLFFSCPQFVRSLSAVIGFSQLNASCFKPTEIVIEVCRYLARVLGIGFYVAVLVVCVLRRGREGCASVARPPAPPKAFAFGG